MYTFIFDIDGTITPVGGPIPKLMELVFIRRMFDRKFYLVSGSDYARISGQVGEKVLELSAGCFASCGTQMYVNGVLEWSNDTVFDNRIYKYLQDYIDNSPFSYKYGNHIVDRKTSINFSVSGRNCPYNMRSKYIEYDYNLEDRFNIKKQLESLFDVDVFLGGTLSVDIVPKGAGKHLIFDRMIGDFQFVFFGDRCFEGGNDKGLSDVILQNGGIVHSVNDWTDTYDILYKNYI